eukprot:4279191-Alexandrium_andersonii.AAC.2
MERAPCTSQPGCARCPSVGLPEPVWLPGQWTTFALNGSKGLRGGKGGGRAGRQEDTLPCRTSAPSLNK